MFTIIILGVFILAIIIMGGCFIADKDYKEALMCVAVLLISIMSITDIISSINEIRDKMRTQAVEYGYAKYEVDSKGSSTFAWIAPKPPIVEPSKKPDKVVVPVEKEKN